MSSSESGPSLCYVMDLTHDMSDCDLIGIISTVLQNMENGIKQGSRLSFKLFSSSWDQDSRELWQIPEAKQLFKRMIGMGWYGIFPLIREFEMAGDEHQGAVTFEDHITPILIGYGDANGVEQNRTEQIIKTSVGIFNQRFSRRIKELRELKWNQDLMDSEDWHERDCQFIFHFQGRTVELDGHYGMECKEFHSFVRREFGIRAAEITWQDDWSDADIYEIPDNSNFICCHLSAEVVAHPHYEVLDLVVKAVEAPCVLEREYNEMGALSDAFIKSLPKTSMDPRDLKPIDMDIDPGMQIINRLLKEQGFEEENCPICHDPLTEKPTSSWVHCKHCFHEECINEWRSEHSHCPLCRAEDKDLSSRNGQFEWEEPSFSGTDSADDDGFWWEKLVEVRIAFAESDGPMMHNGRLEDFYALGSVDELKDLIRERNNLALDGWHLETGNAEDPMDRVMRFGFPLHHYMSCDLPLCIEVRVVGDRPDFQLSGNGFVSDEINSVLGAQAWNQLWSTPVNLTRLINAVAEANDKIIWNNWDNCDHNDLFRNIVLTYISRTNPMVKSVTFSPEYFTVTYDKQDDGKFVLRLPSEDFREHLTKVDDNQHCESDFGFVYWNEGQNVICKRGDRVQVIKNAVIHRDERLFYFRWLLLGRRVQMQEEEAEDQDYDSEFNIGFHLKSDEQSASLWCTEDDMISEITKYVEIKFKEPKVFRLWVPSLGQYLNWRSKDVKVGSLFKPG